MSVGGKLNHRNKFPISVNTLGLHTWQRRMFYGAVRAWVLTVCCLTLVHFQGLHTLMLFPKGKCLCLAHSHPQIHMNVLQRWFRLELQSTPAARGWHADCTEDLGRELLLTTPLCFPALPAPAGFVVRLRFHTWWFCSEICLHAAKVDIKSCTKGCVEWRVWRGGKVNKPGTEGLQPNVD